MTKSLEKRIADVGLYEKIKSEVYVWMHGDQHRAGVIAEKIAAVVEQHYAAERPSINIDPAVLAGARWGSAREERDRQSAGVWQFTGLYGDVAYGQLPPEQIT